MKREDEHREEAVIDLGQASAVTRGPITQVIVSDSPQANYRLFALDGVLDD